MGSGARGKPRCSPAPSHATGVARGPQDTQVLVTLRMAWSMPSTGAGDESSAPFSDIKLETVVRSDAAASLEEDARPAATVTKTEQQGQALP